MKETKQRSFWQATAPYVFIGLTAATLAVVSNRNIRSMAVRSAQNTIFDLLQAQPDYAITNRSSRLNTPSSDTDRDFDVDLADYQVFSNCLTGPSRRLSEKCAYVDLDGDGDVDLRDYAAFQRCYTGNELVSNPSCAE